MYRRDPAQAEAAAASRRRRDAAPWLRDQAPQLERLRLTFDDERPDGTSAQRYAQPVLVESAKAHFEVRCMVPRCDGLHDLTAAIVRVLREKKTTASIRSQCLGAVNNIPCVSTLICTCEAGYRD